MKKEGHLVQQLDPNPEGLLLAMVGKGQGQNIKTLDFRNKCKDAFKAHFGYEAHKLPEKRSLEIFNTVEIFKKTLPVLHALFNE